MHEDGLVRVTQLASAADTAAIASQLMLIDGDQQNNELKNKGIFATSIIEEKTGHVAKSSQFRYTVPKFPFRGGGMSRYMHNNARIILPRYPLISVDTFTYVNTSGDTITMSGADYQVATTPKPGYVTPARYGYWPIADPMSVEAVSITFTAGYTTVPVRYAEVCKIIAAFFYVNRDVMELPEYLENLVMGLEECPAV